MTSKDEKTIPTSALVSGTPHSNSKGGTLAPMETASDISHVEHGKQSNTSKWHEAGLSEEEASFLANVSPEEESKIYRKIDYRVVPMLTMLYLISHLDRANLGAYLFLQTVKTNLTFDRKCKNRRPRANTRHGRH